ncbi:MAG: acyltransferase [Eubacteriales bacterium]|nr:acyltransferase [Eubacteriales bacterium]
MKNANSLINRIALFDYIRALATIFLIITHIIMMDIEFGNVSEEYLLVSKIISTITISCNVMFLFLSGALLLPYKEEEILSFYNKRIIKIIIPMFVYYFLYLIVNKRIIFFPPTGLKYYILNILSGNVPEAPHMWILYIIITFYIICPFLRILLKNLKYNQLFILILISFVCIIIKTLCVYLFKINFVLDNPLTLLVFLPIYGYFLMKDETKKYYNFIFSLGIISLIILFLLCISSESYLNICANSSPISISIVSSIFVLFKKYEEKFKNNIIINSISKYSFSIVLIHWLIIPNITFNFFNIHICDGYYIGGLLFTIIISLFFSFFIAFIIDNTIILLLNKIFYFIKRFLIKTEKING